MSRKLCKWTMIDCDASVHVCPLKKTRQGDGFRKSSETRPLPGAEMQQRGIRQVSYDTEVGSWTRDDQSGRWVHDGLGLRCVLHEGPMLECKKKGKNLR